MENIEKFEQLLTHYSFAELSHEEKQWVMAFIGSEEEYESLRHTNQQLDNFKSQAIKIEPHPEMIKKIKASWKEANVAPSYNFWTITPIPTYATVLIVISVGFFCWVMGSRTNSKTLYVDHVKSTIDTVFIASRPDTIVRTKIIYVEQPVTARVQILSKTNQPQSIISKGVNMKDKEELEKLLVSGSEL